MEKIIAGVIIIVLVVLIIYYIIREKFVAPYYEIGKRANNPYDFLAFSDRRYGPRGNSPLDDTAMGVLVTDSWDNTF